MGRKIISLIRKELEKHADPEYRQGFINFFKEQVDLIGVRSAQRREISKTFFKEIKHFSKEQIFVLCDEMLQQDLDEFRSLAYWWALKLKPRFERSDFAVFENWLAKFVENWAACDGLCGYPFGHLLLKFPDTAPRLKAWTNHKNRWFRRASTVALIPGIRKGLFIEQLLQTVEDLMQEDDDLVRKGMGWALREAAKQDEPSIFKFILEHKSQMPRVTLRYAIERMSPNMKVQAMSKA